MKRCRPSCWPASAITGYPGGEGVLTCGSLVELLTDFLEGAVSEDVHGEVVTHLSDCSDCLRYVAQIQLTVRLLGQLPAPPLADTTVAELAAAFHRHAPRGAGQSRL